jgi:tetratricopeptide (TPR) repeat protein
LLVGESLAAKSCWEKALRLDPNFGFAQHGLGKICLLQADYRSAVEYLRQAVESQEFAEPVHDLSDAYLKLGEVPQAISVLADFAADHPDAAETSLLLGQAYLADRQFELAKTAFEKTLELRPDSLRAQEGLGKALLRLGDREAARELLEKQRNNRGSESRNLSPEEHFQGECRDLCKHYFSAAQVYAAGGALQQAIKVLDKATLLDPHNMRVWTMLLTQAERQGNLPKALKDATRMCRENPENSGAFFTLGILQAKAGRTAAAKASLEEVIRLAPESFSGYEALARLLIKTRSDLPRTVGLAEKVVELRGAAVDHELLGQALVLNGKFDRAEECLASAIRLDPNNKLFQEAMRQLRTFRENRHE